MTWLSNSIEHIKEWTVAYKKQRAFEAALKRDRERNAEFWATIGTHLGSEHQTTLSNRVIPVFQEFLSQLEVPLKDNPDSALLGSPLLQLYFGYSGFNGITGLKEMSVVHKWDTEQKILALALNAGLPVTPGLSEMFVGCCEHKTEFLNANLMGRGGNKSRFIVVPNKRPGHVYPRVMSLPQVYLRQLFSNASQQETCARAIGAHRDKFLAGAQLLEAFGANWKQISSEGKTLGGRLFEQLGQPEELKKYATSIVEVDVDEIIAQKKRDKKVEFSNNPRLKL